MHSRHTHTSTMSKKERRGKMRPTRTHTRRDGISQTDQIAARTHLLQLRPLLLAPASPTLAHVNHTPATDHGTISAPARHDKGLRRRGSSRGRSRRGNKHQAAAEGGLDERRLRTRRPRPLSWGGDGVHDARRWVLALLAVLLWCYEKADVRKYSARDPKKDTQVALCFRGGATREFEGRVRARIISAPLLHHRQRHWWEGGREGALNSFTSQTTKRRWLAALQRPNPPHAPSWTSWQSMPGLVGTRGV